MSPPPKTALERSYLTENSSSENRILKPRRMKTPDRIQEERMIISIFIYVAVRGWPRHLVLDGVACLVSPLSFDRCAMLSAFTLMSRTLSCVVVTQTRLDARRWSCWRRAGCPSTAAIDAPNSATILRRRLRRAGGESSNTPLV